MQLQAIVRDGGTKMAAMNGIDSNIVLIDVPYIENDEVLDFYRILEHEVDCAFYTGRVRMCNDWEMWGGRRCERFCEVIDACKLIDG